MSEINVVFSGNLNSLYRKNKLSIERSTSNLLLAILSGQDDTGVEDQLSSSAQFFSDAYSFWNPPYNDLEREKKYQYAQITEKLINQKSINNYDIEHLLQENKEYIDFILPTFESSIGKINIFISNDPILNRLFFYNNLNKMNELLANNIVGLLAICGMKFLFPAIPVLKDDEKKKIKEKLRDERQEYIAYFRSFVSDVKSGIQSGNILDVVSESEFKYNQEILKQKERFDLALKKSKIKGVKAALEYAASTSVSITKTVLDPSAVNIADTASKLLKIVLSGAENTIKTNCFTTFPYMSYIYKIDKTINI